MNHHMQITAVVILLSAHSYIVLGGEDAIWQVLDVKVSHSDERYLAIAPIELKILLLSM